MQDDSPSPPLVPLAGWGRSPVVLADVRASEDLSRVSQGAVLSRGLGRAYGDAALPPRGAAVHVARTTLADRLLAFDPASGVLTAEAGVSLGNLTSALLPRGFFTPVSPGTRFVTLGGMVASDIHGKNHHAEGTFGNFVDKLRLRVASGDIVDCSRTEHPELFFATLGGMGLTGHILEVTCRMRRVPSPYIVEESEQAGHLRDVVEQLGAASHAWPLTAAWVDTTASGSKLGRGILLRGRWAEPGEAPPGVPALRAGPRFPVTLPSGLMNRWSIGLANAIWFHKHGKRQVHRVIPPSAAFWQLDLATDWNRAYGKRGFTQYQCVMPSDWDVYQRFLERFKSLGGCSFITVFKDCGPEGEGYLSFPMAGSSMALDIPINSQTPRLIRELDAFVLDHGGRVYLAKDAFTSAATFRKMYPRFEQFQAVREQWDPTRKLRSAQSVRLMGDPP